MGTKEKKEYIAPHVDEIILHSAGMIALSGKSVGVFPGADPLDASGAFANPFRGWGFDQ